MKFFVIAFIAIACIRFSDGKSLKDYYGNKVSTFKGQRKPLASPVVNGIHDNYTRSKRHIPSEMAKFQELIKKSKYECAKELKMNKGVLLKSIMNEENPTSKEKCLMGCMLKKIGLMDKTNRLNLENVAQLAGRATNNNPLAMSIAKATAHNCNSSIRATNSCDAGYQINKCVAYAINTHKLNLIY